MPIHDAVVVAVHPSQESNLVVELLTRDLGVLSCLARGARSSRKRFPSGIDVLTRVSIQQTPPPRGDLHQLHSAEITNAYLALRAEPVALGRAAYAAEMAAALTPRGHAAEEVFDLLVEVLDALCGGPCGPGLLRFTEVRMLVAVGELPPVDACASCGGRLEAGAMVLDVQPGHVWCTGCAPRGARALPQPVTRLLEQCMQWTPLEAGHAEVTELTSVTAGKLLMPVLRHVVGRPLRSARFLASMERTVASAPGGDKAQRQT